MRTHNSSLTDPKLPKKGGRHNAMLDRCLSAEAVSALKEMTRINAMYVYQKGVEQEHDVRSVTVKKYLHEIRHYPMLTKEDEINLGKSMERGIWASAVREGTAAAESLIHANSQADIPSLKALIEVGKRAAVTLGLAGGSRINLISLQKQNKQELEDIIAQAREARDRLTVSNMRLVVHIARWYVNRGLSFLDLIQEGNLGLIKAVERFDYKRRFRFSTYATWWIKQAITHAIATEARMIRLPAYVLGGARKVRKAKQEYINEYGFGPTVEELSKLVRIDVREIYKIEKLPITVPILDQVIQERDGTEYVVEDLIIDCLSPEPSMESIRMLLKEQLHKAIDQLSEKEREIIKLRYGLDDNRPWSLRDVCSKLNITRERVRQLEIKGINKLKHPARRTKLKRFYKLILQCKRELTSACYHGRLQKSRK